MIFGYLNPLLWWGLEESCERIAAAGADAMLVVDVPPEESAPGREAAARQDLDWIAIVSPTTALQRAQTIAKTTSGFIYVVSMTGVTGGELVSLSAARRTIEAVHAVCQIPACVGFGVRDQ